MSFSVDANLLVYASDVGSPFHAAARELLEERIHGREIFCLTWPTAMAYLRIVTNVGILGSPLTPGEALSNLIELESLPHVRMISEKDGFLALYGQVTAEQPFRGNLVPDAHVATLLLQHDVRTLYTNDGDFRRFSFLDVRNPFRES